MKPTRLVLQPLELLAHVVVGQDDVLKLEHEVLDESRAFACCDKIELD